MTPGYYDDKIKYTTDDMALYVYNFDVLSEPINSIMEGPRRHWSKRLEVEIQILAPNSKSQLIEDFYTRGEIKSHEINELLKVLNDKIMNALEAKATALFQSLTGLYNFRSCIEIQYKKTLISSDVKNKKMLFTVMIKLIKLERFTPEAVINIIKEFNISKLGFCDEVSIKILT